MCNNHIILGIILILSGIIIVFITVNYYSIMYKVVKYKKHDERIIKHRITGKKIKQFRDHYGWLKYS